MHLRHVWQHLACSTSEHGPSSATGAHVYQVGASCPPKVQVSRVPHLLAVNPAQCVRQAIVCVDGLHHKTLDSQRR